MYCYIAKIFGEKAYNLCNKMLSFSAFNVAGSLNCFQRVLIASEPVKHICMLEPVDFLLALEKLQSLLEVFRLNQSSKSRLDCPRLILLNREDYQ